MTIKNKNIKDFTKVISVSILALLISNNLAFANPVIVEDNRTQVNQVNNIPVVNIATPTINGVSRNTYKEFNVGEQGLVFNNSIDSVNSQLAGQLEKNPNLSDRSANLIVNEVVGGNLSQLKGTMEIVGNRANLVIANPNGIVANGVSLVNSRMLFLSTGKPVFNKKDLLNFEITKGKVTIGEKGLDASSAEVLDISARSFQLNGQVTGTK
ncbi:filamentous hemagglutinin N-terminal domain-containing protein [Xenorhabdus bovienii]|uniref:filamentous hemagglutinin N-terminal domain-containing protein n=1 Tax=Xenorhabdus bovienii TaxID=40576 RepID=UPI0023B27580|nr:filamentous hemagglutinin N-terminal domain-containing protein [Xenorhabdus bovienii]MDE9544228.1 filamentous hemagglutinin N-terminal domain-containing protein [Xenorhabdus bovienii]